jgi:hypothetical protein
VKQSNATRRAHALLAEFKPARLTRSETVSLLGLGPLLAHAFLACLSPCPPSKHCYSRFSSSLSLNVSFSLRSSVHRYLLFRTRWNLRKWKLVSRKLPTVPSRSRFLSVPSTWPLNCFERCEVMFRRTHTVPRADFLLSGIFLTDQEPARSTNAPSIRALIDPTTA